MVLIYFCESLRFIAFWLKFLSFFCQPRPGKKSINTKIWIFSGMEKKTIFLELPSEMIERIDRENVAGDRSQFISDLLEKQLQQEISEMDVSSEISTKMSEGMSSTGPHGEISLVNNKGMHLGRFDINTVEGFEQLTMKICELSNDPIVRLKARRMR
jgi:hypothetical protein